MAASLALPSSVRPWSLSFRAFQCWLTVCRRIWRSSIWSSVLGPVCYLVLLRDLTVGVVGPGLLWRAAYLAALGVAGLYASGRRIGKLLLL